VLPSLSQSQSSIIDVGRIVADGDMVPALLDDSARTNHHQSGRVQQPADQCRCPCKKKPAPD